MYLTLGILKSASFLSFILAFTGYDSTGEADRLLGNWESEEKNLHIEIFKVDDHFVGRTTWFHCITDQTMMCTYRDTENPDPKLSCRTLIDLEVVQKIFYRGEDVWGDGKIYDPNTGHTYDAEIRLVSPNTVIVRGYWKIRWLGKSMVFNRLQ